MNNLVGPPRKRGGPCCCVVVKERYHIESGKHLHVELTPEQFRILTENAQACGLSKRAYLVRLIEETEVKARPSREIKELRTEIHHIGNNINQIARSVNAGIVRAGDAERGLRMLDQVYELMYEIAKK